MIQLTLHNFHELVYAGARSIRSLLKIDYHGVKNLKSGAPTFSAVFDLPAT
jgi:hypothetical protein